MKDEFEDLEKQMNEEKKAGWSPPWWDEDLKKCDCNGETKTIRSHTGYSDFKTFRQKCCVCGREWCWWYE